MWMIVFKIADLADYPFDLNTYGLFLLSFLPLILITLIPVEIAYRLFLYKYVGETYYVYVLAFYGITIIPAYILRLASLLG